MKSDIDRRNSAALVRAIRGAVKLPPYRPGSAAGAVPVPGLPLETDLVLDGVDLNEYLVRGLPEQVQPVALFEAFLRYVLFPDEDEEPEPPWHWFNRESGLTHAQSRWLLPPGATPMQIGTVLLWLCAQSGLDSIITKDRFTVCDEDGDVIGFAGGIALSSDKMLKLEHPPVDFADTLARRTISRVGYSRTLAFNAAWVRAHSIRRADKGAVLLALQILYWRSNTTAFAVECLYGI